jgi:5-methylcytosine-specific restriction endonuclease McrA
MPYADPEKRREAGREYTRRYRERNSEKARESNRESARKRRRLGLVKVDRVKARAATKRWREANREKRREYNRAYYHRTKHVTRGYHKRDPEMARVLLADPCSYCGGPGGEIDHIDAWSLTADASWTNLTAACRTCNASKNATPLLRFLLRA